MTRHAPSSSDDGDWAIVSARQPCTVCGSAEGCRVGYDKEFACCSRRPSQWPVTTGGWIHRLEAIEVEVSRVA